VINMNKNIFFLLVFLFFVSCGEPTKELNSNKLNKVGKLTYDDLFNGIKIDRFLTENKNQPIESNQLFLQAVDLYRNKKSFDQAEDKFKQSIIEHPTGNAYFELGNLYLDTKQFDKSIKAYQLAEQLDFQPVSSILYNLACAYSKLHKEELAAKYLESALIAGYSNIDNIKKDKDLAYFRESYYFERCYQRGLLGIGDPDKLMWQQYEKQFPVSKLPLNLDPFISESIYNKDNSISYEFEKFVSEMRSARFSRDTGKEFYFLAKISNNENYTALVYLIRDYYTGCAVYKLATYDRSGKLIDKREIGGRTLIDSPMKTAVIDTKNSVHIKKYTVKYEKEFELGMTYGADNKLISKELIGSEDFAINTNGLIETKSSSF
jgi:tetratricopeptide (TPR) repeat protein